MQKRKIINLITMALIIIMPMVVPVYATEAEIINEQAAPIGLVGIAPTSELNNGKITGTTIAMEYKLATDEDSSYKTCTDVKTTVETAGEYLIRFAEKTGYNAGAIVNVTVPEYIIPNEEQATPNEEKCEFDNSFELGLSNATVIDGSVVEGNQVITNKYNEDEKEVIKEWTVSPNLNKMLALTPSKSAVYTDVKDIFGFSKESDDYLKEQFPNITDVSYMCADVDLDADEVYSMAWQYVSTDYTPYNDSSFVSFVYLDDPTSIPLIYGVRTDVSILGATVLGTGNYSTDSYGATGWQTATLKANAAGKYRVAFAVFNLDDNALSPWLFLDNPSGTTSLNGQPFSPIGKDPNAPPPAGEVIETGGHHHSSKKSTPPTKNVNIIINGEKQNVGTETQTKQGTKIVKTVDVNDKMVDAKINEIAETLEENPKLLKNNIVEVPVVAKGSDKLVVSLTGDLIKKMEESNFKLSVKEENVEYTIPAKEITIDTMAKNLGVNAHELNKIDVEVQITKVEPNLIKKMEEVAKQNKNQLIVPPVKLEVYAKSTGVDGKVKEVSVSKFSNYVERIMEIPVGVEPNKITTGIVFNADGTYSHVPTDIFKKNGKWYARINSLTNSIYSVIYNPITIESVKNHWAEESVNDMASRLVLINYKNFEAEKAVTRAEFVDYIVRALGLYREDTISKSTFTDVIVGSKNQVSIQIASNWGIISGYPDGTFRETNTITRQEAMVMCARAMNIANILENKVNKLSMHTDSAKASKWAIPFVQRAVNAEIFNGKSKYVLDPKGILTQAESLTVVRKLLLKSELINKNISM